MSWRHPIAYKKNAAHFQAAFFFDFED